MRKMTHDTLNEVSKNSIFGIANRVLAIILGLIFRRIFILYLGENLSGLSSLYTNLLNFLGLATAGLSVSSIQKIFFFNARGDIESIKKIENFTNYFYRLVSVFILLTGVLSSIFPDKMIYNNTYDIGFLRLIFIIQVLSECVGYLYYSKKVILQAYAQIYVISIIEIIINTIFYALQIFAIVVFRSYVLYALSLPLKYFVIGFLEKSYTIKHYNWLNQKKKTSFREMRYLLSDVKNTVVMQIAQFIFLSTDSIVISKFLGLASVNYFDNYIIIVNSLTSIVDEVNAALRASYGIILAKDESKNAQTSFVDSNTLIGHFIGSFCGISFLCVADRFIVLWLGPKYVISYLVLILLTAMFYVSNIGSALKSFMAIKGYFDEDKKITIIAAFINIVLSVVLVNIIGLSGVVIGTLMGNIFMLIGRALFFFGKIIKHGVFEFFYSLFIFVSLFVVEAFVTMVIVNSIKIGNSMLSIGWSVIVCCIIPNMMNYVLFRKSKVVKLLESRFKEKIHLWLR